MLINKFLLVNSLQKYSEFLFWNVFAPVVIDLV